MNFKIDWHGQTYQMEWFDEIDFETLENVVQSYGFIFDDNEHVCIVNCEGKRWSLPGGASRRL